MPYSVHSTLRSIRLRLSVLLLGLVAACGGSDQLSPSTDLPLAVGDSLPPVDSAAVPVDSTLLTPTDSLASVSPLTALTAPGIPFGTANMPASGLSAVQTATMQGLEPAWLMSELAATRAKGARLILKMVGGPDDRIKNSDGTFSLTKWKALVYRFKSLPLGPYITDGTLSGNFLIDEPHNPNKWGGKMIPQATVEAMAKYSKSLWPTLTTFVRVMPTWLAQSTMTYTYIDAGWLQYESYMGNVATKLTNEVAAAKKKGVGLMVGLNVLDGGNGSSGVRGTRSGKYAMSATEIRNYGTTLLNQTYSCGFLNWTYILGGATYFSRSDVKSALTDLSNKAKAHVKTSCRQ